MRLLYIGPTQAGSTSHMRIRAFARLGYEVQTTDTVLPWERASWIQRQLQRRIMRGPVIDEINRSVLASVRAFRPDWVWAEKQEYLRADTLRNMQKLGARVVHFTPDPYFSLSWKQTRLMDEAIGCFDALVYCKSYERDEYAGLGLPLVYMPLGYCDETHRPLPSENPKWRANIATLGGWEPHRQEMIRSLIVAGMDVKVWGFHWDVVCDGRWTPRRHVILHQIAGDEKFSFNADPIVAAAYQGIEVYGDDYARALSGAAIGLGFLRHVCPEQHTTRTFEIPACGSMLLAERSEEHEALFDEGREAEFFTTTAELVDKARFYLKNESRRLAIAAAGRQRCASSGYSYVDRLSTALSALDRVL